MKNPVTDDLFYLVDKHIEEHCSTLNVLCNEHSFYQHVESPEEMDKILVRSDRYSREFEKVFASVSSIK